MELVISVVIGILIVEAYAWLPKISEWFIERAVLRLRKEDRDRCREEWNAGLDALPNTVVKLVHALSYIGAAQRINTDYFEIKLTEIDALIEEFSREHSGIVVSVRAAKDELGRSQTNLRQELDILLADSRVQAAMDVSNNKLASSLQNAARALVRLADFYASANGRAAELLTVCIDSWIERLNHVQSLILGASKKRDRVTELLGCRGVSPDILDTLVADLASDLRTVKSMFEDDKWGDDDALREHERIRAVIIDTVRSLSPPCRVTKASQS